MTDCIDVKCFGATGDGVTDDSVAIRTAITAAVSTHHRLYFSPGTYLVSHDGTNAWCIAPPSNLEIYGAGVGVSVIKMADGQPAQTRIFSLINVSGVHVHDLTLNGNKAGQPADEHKHGLFLMAARRITVERIECCDFLGDGISTFTDVSDVTVRDCHIHDCDRDGIAFTGAGERFLVDHCHIHAIASQPIDSEPEPGAVAHVVIRNCTIEALPSQFAITTGGHSTASLNQFWVIDGNTITGSIDAIRVEGLCVVNNAITGDGNAEAAVNGRYKSSRVFIAHNSITVTANPAISVVASAGEAPERWIITGNTIDMSGAGNAILLQGAASAQISSNFITGVGGGYGVNVFATAPLESLVIESNTISGVGTAVYFARHESNTFKRVLVAHNLLTASVGIHWTGAADTYDTIATAANIIDAPSPLLGLPGLNLVV